MAYMSGPLVSLKSGFEGDRSSAVRIEGADEMIARLMAMWEKIGPRYIRGSVVKAMKPMKTQLRANTPIGPTANLRQSIADKVKIYQSGTVFGIVGYRRDVAVKTGATRGKHSHLVEFGTQARYPKKGPFLSSFRIQNWTPAGWRGRWPLRAKFVRPARGQHPMLRAYQATAAQCVKILEDEMAKSLERAVADEAKG